MRGALSTHGTNLRQDERRIADYNCLNGSIIHLVERKFARAELPPYIISSYHCHCKLRSVAAYDASARRNLRIRRARRVKVGHPRPTHAEGQLRADEEMARRLQEEERVAARGGGTGTPLAAAAPLSDAAFEQLYGSRFAHPASPCVLAVPQRPRGTLHVTVIEGLQLDDQAREAVPHHYALVRSARSRPERSGTTRRLYSRA